MPKKETETVRRIADDICQPMMNLPAFKRRRRRDEQLGGKEEMNNFRSFQGTSLHLNLFCKIIITWFDLIRMLTVDSFNFDTEEKSIRRKTHRCFD